MLTSLFLLLAVETAASAALPVTEPDPAHIDAQQMREFNASVPASHPFHIRCHREVETGSLVLTSRICQTNQKWTRADQIGSREARETIYPISSKYEDGEATSYKITSPH